MARFFRRDRGPHPAIVTIPLNWDMLGPDRYRHILGWRSSKSDTYGMAPVLIEAEPGVPHASRVAIRHAPRSVQPTTQAAITHTAMVVDSGSNDDESRSPAGPFTIP